MIDDIVLKTSPNKTKANYVSFHLKSLILASFVYNLQRTFIHEINPLPNKSQTKIMSCIYHVIHSKKIPSAFKGHLMLTNIPLTKRGDLHSFVPLKRKRKKKKGRDLNLLSPQECEETYVYFQILGVYHPPLFHIVWYADNVGCTLLWFKRWAESKCKAQLGYGLFLGSDFIFIFQISDVTSSISIPRGM